jgi:hypothetical protein
MTMGWIKWMDIHVDHRQANCSFTSNMLIQSSNEKYSFHSRLLEEWAKAYMKGKNSMGKGTMMLVEYVSILLKQKLHCDVEIITL